VEVNDGTGPFDYVWSGGLPNGPGPHPVCPATTTTYTVSVTDAGGNAAVASAVVAVYAAAVSNAGPDDGICQGNSAVLNGSGGVSYEWSPPDGLSDPQIPDPVASPDVTTTYTLTVLDANGCVDSDDMTLAVNTIQGIDAGPDVSICPGSSTTLGATGGVVYLWSPATGLSNPNIADPVADPSLTTTYTATITDANGCVGSDAVTVTVDAAPDVDAGPDVSICAGGSTVLNASGGVSYTWSPATGLSATNVASPTAAPLVTTTYTVTATDANGCTGTDAVTVTIGTLQTANAGPDQTICLGGSTTLNASGGATYSWTPATGLSNTDTATPAANPLSSTTYTVTVTDANGCSGTDAMTLTVEPLEFADAGADQGVCPGATATLGASGGVAYAWSPATGLSNTNTADPTVSPTGNVVYTVLVTDANGCYDSDDVAISLLTQPTVSLGEDFEACLGQARLIAANGQPGQSYTWSTGETGQIITVTSSGNYSVTASNPCGSASDGINVVFVDCECYIYVPNAFTPNGDGFNDTWQPVVCPVEDFELFIFNRWGEMIWTTTDQSEPWKGLVIGGGEVVAQDEVYIYLLKLGIEEGNDKQITGTVTLLR
jgi:gliding motility-associated-like protein